LDFAFSPDAKTIGAYDLEALVERGRPDDRSQDTGVRDPPCQLFSARADLWRSGR
jgi:hypothetical protein